MYFHFDAIIVLFVTAGVSEIPFLSYCLRMHNYSLYAVLDNNPPESV